MREIKFRAYSKQLNDFLTITGFEIKDGEIIELIHNGDFIGYDKEDVTIQQYTGLKDKNGKEIYEGDILKDKDSNAYLIEYNNFRFECKNFYLAIQDDASCIFSEHAYKKMEIIGNIYENPELLKSV